MRFIVQYLKSLRKKAEVLYTKDILRLIQKDPCARILDVGCDDGEWTVKIAEAIGTNDIYGIDIVPQSILKASARGIKAIVSEISFPFPFADNSFDIVHSNQVIEHLNRTEHFVREIYRVLKPGGYTIVCTENLASWHNIFSLMFGWMPMSSSNFSDRYYNVGNPLALHSDEKACLPESWQHIRVLSIKGLRDIFRINGFKEERVLGAGYYPLPASFARLDKTHAAFMTAKFTKPRVCTQSLLQP